MSSVHQDIEPELTMAAGASLSTPPHDTTVRLLEDGSSEQWDGFVRERDGASIYHLAAWRPLIRSMFGHETLYLYAEHNRQVTGVLPLVRLRSRMFGDYLISMPYFNYGGALAADAAVASMLMRAAADLAHERGCSHVEFRDTEPRHGWPVRTDKVGMELRLPGSIDALWEALGAKLRSQVKRPQKAGAEGASGGRELLPEFYGVFARNMRDLGTPVYALGFFDAILKAFPTQAQITVVRYRGEAVAAGFTLGFRGRLEIPWASANRDYNALSVNMLLYAEVLKRAIADGYTVFDFGRSSIDSGTYRFKKQWDATERQLYWHYALPPGRDVPRLTPNNPKYRLAIAMWQRLPLFVTNRLGPFIVKNLP